MTRLLWAFALLQLADLVTFLQAPALEANPVMAGMDPDLVVVVKLLAILAASWLVVASRAWSPRGRAALEVALIAGIAWGAFGAGADAATLAGPPRPASGQAPTVRATAGYEWAPVGGKYKWARGNPSSWFAPRTKRIVVVRSANNDDQVITSRTTRPWRSVSRKSRPL